MQPVISQRIDSEDPHYIEKRNNRKLTADKIRQILSKVLNNPSSSSKRWIWELMQNAKDVPNTKFKEVSIQIILSHDKLIFKHNGDPFSLSNIFSLIQQVSSKDSANNDEEVTGKFGTGFIATHLLSEVIDVAGYVYHKGLFRSFNLQLDRSGRTSEELLPKIDAALDHANKIEDNSLFPIADNYQQNRTETSYDTSFTYYLSSEERIKSAITGIDDLVNTLPVTLVNIDKIKRVEVINQIKGYSEVYTRDIHTENYPIKQVRVTISRGVEVIYRHFVKYSKAELALTTEVNDFNGMNLILRKSDAPNLYRDFPLIGSEKFYFPYILNGFKFNPTEDRDGILLHSTEAHEAHENRKIIEQAFVAAKEFTDWLINCGAKNLYVCAHSRLPDEKWEEFSKAWYLELQKDYRAFLLIKDIVETKDSYLKRSLRFCLIPNFGQTDETKHLFYWIAKDYYGDNYVPHNNLLIPWIKATGPKEELETWGKKIHFTLEDLLSFSETYPAIKYLANRINWENEVISWLNRLYQFIIDENKAALFSDFAIIPNQHGDFYKLSELYLEDKDSPIADVFLDVLTQLDDDWRTSLIHRQISLKGQNIDKRGLSDASEKINEVLNKKLPNSVGAYENQFIKRKDALVLLVNILKNIEESSTKEDFRSKLFFYAKDLFGFKENLSVITHTKKFNFLPALSLFIQFINKKIESCENIQRLSAALEKTEDETTLWLNSYLNTLESSAGFKELLNNGNIVPNQYGIFCALEDIYSFGTEETPLDHELIKILHLLNSQEDWKKELLHEGVSIKVPPRKFDELGTKLDHTIRELEKEELANTGSINVHKKPILDLIKWCKTNVKLAQEYLQYTDSRASELWIKFSMTPQMLNALSNEQSLELLQVLSDANIDPSQARELINAVSNLNETGVDGISILLKHAVELAEEKRDFVFKNQIGHKVEKILENLLTTEFPSLTPKFVGIGPYDFIITNKDNQKSYFIELKSIKESNKEPIKMAISQASHAAKHKENYALCVIKRPQDNSEISSDYLKSELKCVYQVGKNVERAVEESIQVQKYISSANNIKLSIKDPLMKVELDQAYIEFIGKSFQSLKAKIVEQTL
ncbi:DUF3883 domain-containing protein [Porifericola rhodea]|uniref:sacsin N-terminal ATP-binding-like domain-containing protein n=1 Tax=Porifericola rhodea TaxID=930972 RepID=UPI00266687E7|nr:DUF3883 domain-containing protein [Porifericola rhodea]WKN33798.1 DUF3883 domain-containing protein [Porifericola rhodea]